ncbi:alpha/beta hydrolase [Oscillatoria sp. FACHB-1406]|uniref:alpha/beta fold hydrolase n=1 Tax=Oscillatoria sp. FACHB-1406 TaxID=2692846 RepID=UPI001682FE2E|nr:alpha/beta hydrolase [Oscillatoria sp. FACHB-1406]MBD2577755.1 alpha/beta hydrolase [Oscillatoria sp. FACHB-1406]
MFPTFIPAAAERLSEETSIAFLQQMQCEAIATPLSTSPIPTTYVSQGNGGTPILLLHGFDSSAIEFRRLLPLLAAENETRAVDLLGFGFTDRAVGISFGTQAIKTHLYAFWEALIQQPVILVGASMGGATAIDFALTYPEAVSALILIDSAGLTNPPLSSRFMFSPLDSFATEFLRSPRVRQQISRAAYYDKSLASTDAQLCAALHLELPQWNRAIAAFTKSGGYGSFAARLSTLQTPTLIIWGQNDQILGTKAAQTFQQKIPNSTLVWIDRCGHVPHLEKPQETAKAILDWIAVE